MFCPSLSLTLPRADTDQHFLLLQIMFNANGVTSVLQTRLHHPLLKPPLPPACPATAVQQPLPPPSKQGTQLPLRFSLLFWQVFQGRREFKSIIRCAGSAIHTVISRWCFSSLLRAYEKMRKKCQELYQIRVPKRTSQSLHSLLIHILI